MVVAKSQQPRIADRLRALGAANSGPLKRFPNFQRFFFFETCHCHAFVRAEAEHRLLGKRSWLAKIQGLFDGRRWTCQAGCRSTDILWNSFGTWNYDELEVFQHIRRHREISCTNDSWRELRELLDSKRREKSVWVVESGLVQVMEAIQLATRWQTWLSWAKSKVPRDSINWNLQLQVRWWDGGGGGGGGGGGWMRWIWDEYEMNMKYDEINAAKKIEKPFHRLSLDVFGPTMQITGRSCTDSSGYLGVLWIVGIGYSRVVWHVRFLNQFRCNLSAIWMQLMCELNMDRNMDSGKSFDFFGAWGKSWLLYNQHTCLPYLGFLRLFSGWFGGEDFQGGPCGYQQEDGMSESAYAWHHWWTLPRPFFQHLHFV